MVPRRWRLWSLGRDRTVRDLFAGLDQADSLSLDPHKWLYQPVDCGCLLYRDPAAAQPRFSHTGDYAKSLLEDPSKLRFF